MSSQHYSTKQEYVKCLLERFTLKLVLILLCNLGVDVLWKFYGE